MNLPLVFLVKRWTSASRCFRVDVAGTERDALAELLWWDNGSYRHVAEGRLVDGQLGAWAQDCPLFEELNEALRLAFDAGPCAFCKTPAPHHHGGHYRGFELVASCRTCGFVFYDQAASAA